MSISVHVGHPLLPILDVQLLRVDNHAYESGQPKSAKTGYPHDVYGNPSLPKMSVQPASWMCMEAHNNERQPTPEIWAPILNARGCEWARVDAHIYTWAHVYNEQKKSSLPQRGVRLTNFVCRLFLTALCKVCDFYTCPKA